MSCCLRKSFSAFLHVPIKSIFKSFLATLDVFSYEVLDLSNFDLEDLNMID